ncbi:MAG: hypothetical protein ACE5H4_10600 [Candidatus Thorarchaeota archaeon]
MSKTIVPRNAVCPYCGNVMYEVKIPFGQSEQKCGNARCRRGWHEGVFIVLCITVVSRDKRGLGKNKGVMWNIRHKTNGDEGALSFRTLDRSIQLKRKDVLILSVKKQSKGIFKKKWAGNWERKPSKLVNANLNTMWNV